MPNPTIITEILEAEDYEAAVKVVEAADLDVKALHEVRMYLHERRQAFEELDRFLRHEKRVVATEVIWEERAYKLWQLLDEIDSASDLASRMANNEEVYRQLVKNLHNMRWKVLEEAVVDELEKKYPDVPGWVSNLGEKA